MRLGFKGETQVTDQLTGYGKWEYQIEGNSAENENNSWTRVAFAGLKFQMWVLSTTVVTTALFMT